MRIAYEDYLDKVLGGWIGKCIGGTIGARFEGDKNFIEIERDAMFPPEVPPNDDLDLQVLWLKVLEEKGPALTARDLADAWLDGCWYPFNEYGIFRRNHRLGIAPPESGRFGNAFWETGMGCPIRAEIWGYALPGAPDLAARYARLDGGLDHTEQSVGAEEMFAAMSSMAFFVDDWRALAHRFMHYLPAGSPVERLTREAFRAHAGGLSLREARERLLLLAGTPEACDAQINVPFTFLGLLYGGDDLGETMLASLRCGYDTDCTMATAGALLGQILGARRIPAELREAIGDELVMGIQYRREEMTLSALARDTARVGVLMSRALGTGVRVEDAPEMAPLPQVPEAPARLSVAYDGRPVAAPGDRVRVIVTTEGPKADAAAIKVGGPAGWTVLPEPAEGDRRAFTLAAPAAPSEWPMRNLFEARQGDAALSFGIAGAGLWRLLGVGYDAVPDAKGGAAHAGQQRAFNHHFLDPAKPYHPEPPTDADGMQRRIERLLGRPAVIPSYETELDPTRLIGLSGVWAAYAARDVIVPEARPAYLVVGHTDPYRLWLNDELVGAIDYHSPWTPFNREFPVELRAGANRIAVRLDKGGDHLRFTLAIRHRSPAEGQARTYGWSMNAEDWMVDLADRNPM